MDQGVDHLSQVSFDDGHPALNLGTVQGHAIVEEKLARAHESRVVRTDRDGDESRITPDSPIELSALAVVGGDIREAPGDLSFVEVVDVVAAACQQCELTAAFREDTFCDQGVECAARVGVGCSPARIAA